MLRFIYTDAQGNTAEWVLTRWKENSRYIQGRNEADSLPRTFRKDRVQQFLEGEDLLLGEAAPPAPEPAPKALPDARPQILFTGFKAPDRTRLESLAADNGFRVMKTAGRSLTVLCFGYNAGPTKVEAARGGRCIRPGRIAVAASDQYRGSPLLIRIGLGPTKQSQARTSNG